MSTTNKRIQGDYNINTVSSAGATSGNVNVTTAYLNVIGNLVVTGATTSVESTNSLITDNTIVLNNGEIGAGVTLGYSGIEVERGSLPNTGLRWNESLTQWELTTDGSTWNAITSGGISNVVDDTSPQLGGNLDVNGYTITSASNGNVVIDADGTGLVKLDDVLTLQNQGSDPGSLSNYNKLYAKTPNSGGTGVYVVNATYSDELVSKRKAILFGLIL
jgi:hypothetical protein